MYLYNQACACKYAFYVGVRGDRDRAIIACVRASVSVRVGVMRARQLNRPWSVITVTQVVVCPAFRCEICTGGRRSYSAHSALFSPL